MIARLLGWSFGTTTREDTHPRKVPPRASRVGQFEILETRTLLSGLSPHPRIINGTPIDSGQPRHRERHAHIRFSIRWRGRRCKRRVLHRNANQ